MKLSNVLYFFSLLVSTQVWAVNADSTVIEYTAMEDYYMFPIRPNQVNTLAGNMGELRTSHFHAGLDIRTGGQIGLPVYAAASGYISRVTIKVGGYGKALYITHFNKETTVYAHLDKFDGEIAQYVKEQQYVERTPYLDKHFKKNIFVVKKGQIIAYSGNSGSSNGPHLHFEIRNKHQQILNPLKYSFEEIRDTIPPIFIKLAITPKNIHSRVNGQFDRRTFKTTQQQDGNYILLDTVTLFGKVGFELFAYDKLNDVNYKCGISEITFQLDNELVFNQKIDILNLSTQRSILTHYNYPAYVASGKKYHKLYLDDGNELLFYKTNASRGLLNLNKNEVKKGIVTIADVLGNKSTLTFLVNVSPSPSPSNKITLRDLSSDNKISLMENTLVIKQPNDTPIYIELDGQQWQLLPSYSSDKTNCFLWDLRQGIPKKITNGKNDLIYKPLTVVIPNKNYTYHSSNIEVVFSKPSLFDTLYFNTSYQYDPLTQKEYYAVGDPSTSILNKNITVTLKSQVARTRLSKQTTSVYQIDGNQYIFKGGVWKWSGISFKTRKFGQFTILSDTIAPTILPVLISAESIRFTIKDNLSGIKKFDAFVNNQWILMDYDYKTFQIWSNKMGDDPFIGEVRVRVIDNVGNKQNFLTSIH